MSFFKKVFGKITLKKVVEASKDVTIKDILTGKTDNIVNDIIKVEKDYLIASTISEFVKYVEARDLGTVLCSLYVDINYAKDIMKKDPAKAITKLTYILKELDDSIKAIQK